MMLGQRDLKAKASMQCLFGLVNEPYFNLFSSIGFNFKVLTLGRLGLASHLQIELSNAHGGESNRLGGGHFSYD